MPVDDHPVHPSTVRVEGDLYGCHTDMRGVERRGRYLARDGYSYDGRVNFVGLQWTGDLACQVDTSATDPKCKGCAECRK